MITALVPMIAGLEDDWVPSRADIDGAAAELAGKVKAFAAETFPQLPGVSDAQPWLTAWNAYVAEFTAWADSWYVDRWGRRNEVMSYRARFNELVGWWRQLAGASPTGPTPTYAADKVAPPAAQWERTARWVAIGAVAIAAAMAVGQLAGVARSLGRGTR